MLKKIFGAFVNSPSATENPWATAASPDELIAARVCQEIVESFDDWVLIDERGALRVETISTSKLPTKAIHKDNYDYSISLTRERKNGRFAKEIKIETKLVHKGWRRYGDFDTIATTRCFTNGVVNGVKVNASAVEVIFTAYLKLRADMLEAKRVTDLAQRAMEENEMKWNLAEELLDMKRNAQGALTTVHREQDA